LSLRKVRKPGNAHYLGRSRLLTEVKHALQHSQLAVYSRIAGARLLAFVDVMGQLLAADMNGFHSSEEGLKVQAPTSLDIIQALFAVDLIVSDDVIGQAHLF
jgi:hypothetical protein